MRNSSLVEERCAETCTGFKPGTEARKSSRILNSRRLVGEHSIRDEGSSARRTGAYGRENAGMSNRNPAEMAGRRKGKDSLAMEIIQGLGGT